MDYRNVIIACFGKRRSLDSSRAVRAEAVRRTEGCTTAAAEVLLPAGGGSFIARRDGFPGDRSAAVVYRTIVVELTAVAAHDRKDDVSNTATHPDNTVEKAPVANSSKDKEAGEQIDNTTTKRRDHASEGSKDGCGLELKADEKNRQDEHVSGEHTDGKDGNVSIVLNSISISIIESLCERICMGGNERQNAVNKQQRSKND